MNILQELILKAYPISDFELKDTWPLIIQFKPDWASHKITSGLSKNDVSAYHAATERHVKTKRHSTVIGE